MQSRKRLAVIALAVAAVLASAFAAPRNKHNVAIGATNAVEQRLLNVSRIPGLATSLQLVVDLRVVVAYNEKFTLIFQRSHENGKEESADLGGGELFRSSRGTSCKSWPRPLTPGRQ